MAELHPITQTCTPRSGVREGKLTDAHFAAQLDKIVRDPGGYPIYGDPERFFELTYPTKGLRDLLAHVFGRLSGANVPGAEHGVTRLETSFGGGKTRGLITLYEDGDDQIAIGVGGRGRGFPAVLWHFADKPRRVAVTGDGDQPAGLIIESDDETLTLVRLYWG